MWLRSVPLDLLVASGVVIVATVLLEWRTLKSAIASLRAIREHDANEIVIRVDDEKYVVSLTDPESGVDAVRRANTAIKEARAKLIEAA